MSHFDLLSNFRLFLIILCLYLCLFCLVLYFSLAISLSRNISLFLCLYLSLFPFSHRWMYVVSDVSAQNKLTNQRRLNFLLSQLKIEVSEASAGVSWRHRRLFSVLASLKVFKPVEIIYQNE